MSDAPPELEARYGALDRLSSRLFREVVTHVHGDLLPRLEAFAAMREALLAGRLPAAHEIEWPAEELRRSLLRALADARVAEYCDADPEVTDDMLLFVLGAIRETHSLYERALLAFEALARKDQKRWVTLGPHDEAAPQGDTEALFDQAEWERIRREAMEVAASSALALIRARTSEQWGAHTEAFLSLKQAFEALERVLPLPPGSARGFLKALPRRDLLHMRSLLSHAPRLMELIELLGRLRETDDPSAPTTLERIGRSVRRVVESRGQVQIEEGTEIRGVERSGELARMLPCEAALLLNPTFRLLWKARFAEQALLTYHAAGVMTNRIQQQEIFEDGDELEHRRAARGPIMVVLDTSGSMRGAPELLARALVMQLLSVAFIEERPCYVYNFSGPGDVAEHELSFDGEGMARALAFMSLSFGGGTRADEALLRAFLRLDLGRWKQSDIVLVSDGLFELERGTVARIRRLRRDSKARLHGVRVARMVGETAITIGPGDGFDGLECEQVHDVRMLCDILERGAWA